ncbi:DNA polymerase III subunit delta' [Helicobacter equorum]|uniref:DNA polymerase III subunit delta n=1 Tax=Helicobacter equorum TaxID=361872 RepID=A0A3D8IM71_9HELI|nr:DNA polymerase III subunit delta' [Helicobacter equorum]RDU65744.1 DNA polymerase III subunit delta' [Helicobacter equorum]
MGLFVGELHISAQPQEIVHNITATLQKGDYVIFHPTDSKGKELEFRIDDAREVIAQSYLASDRERFLILMAPSYSIEAQNALLKILEEPPQNVHFVLIVPSKNALLPTILSRLHIHIHKSKKTLSLFELDMKKLTLSAIYEFLRDCDRQSRSIQEIKDHIQALLFAVHTSGICLNRTELEAFDEAIALADSYTKESYIFLPLLLKIHKKQRGVR